MTHGSCRRPLYRAVVDGEGSIKGKQGQDRPGGQHRNRRVPAGEPDREPKGNGSEQDRNGRHCDDGHDGQLPHVTIGWGLRHGDLAVDQPVGEQVDQGVHDGGHDRSQRSSLPDLSCPRDSGENLVHRCLPSSARTRVSAARGYRNAIRT
jgi:hypothetical protein